MLKKNPKQCEGFTLIELLVTMALSMLAVASMYGFYESTNKNYAIQEQVTEAENNLRAAASLLNYDLKTAGYDPDGTGNAGITSADDNSITFTRDEDGNGAIDAGETIAYSLVGSELLRNVGSGDEAVAENIQELEFYYNDASTAPPADLAAIRTITVSLLAVTANPDRGFDTQTFTTPSGVNWTTEAGHRGKFTTFTVYCRNMGL